MRERIMRLVYVCLLVASLSSRDSFAQITPVLQPPALVESAPYRLILTTSETIMGNSGDIEFYNDFAQDSGGRITDCWAVGT